MPSTPQVTLPLPKSEKDLPSDSGWDTAETVTSLPPEAVDALPIPEAAPTPKGGIVAPVSSAPSPPPPPAAERTSPDLSLQLSAPQREEVWAIVRAAIGEATAPMLSKQRELEERVRRAEQAAANATARSNSIPVTGLSISPEGPRPPQKSIRLSVPPGVYGVGVIDAGEQRPAVDTSNVIIGEMPNFGRSKWVAKGIAAVIITIVAAAFIAMIVSRS